MILTEEAMKRFERDVNEGKDITINDYISTNYKDYSNNVTKVGAKTGKFIEEFITGGISRVIKVLGKLFIN